MDSQKFTKQRFRTIKRFRRIKFIKNTKIEFDRRKFRNRQPQFKCPENSTADELLKSIAEKDIEKVKTNLDKIWRKDMLAGKDFDAIRTAQEFLREVQPPSKNGQK